MRVLAAVVLLFALTPGVDEVFEQLVHVLATGHVAHLTEGERDLGHDDEHGCRPNAHACGCCTNVPVVHAAVDRWTTPPRLAGVIVGGEASPPRDPSLDQVFRPPIRS